MLKFVIKKGKDYLSNLVLSFFSILFPFLFSVMYMSVHKYLDGKEWPYLRESDYDHIGEGAGVGYNINIPINVVSLYENTDLSGIFPLLYHNCGTEGL